MYKELVQKYTLPRQKKYIGHHGYYEMIAYWLVSYNLNLKQAKKATKG